MSTFFMDTDAMPTPIARAAGRTEFMHRFRRALLLRKDAYFFLSRPTRSRVDSRLFSIPARNSWNLS